MLGWLLLSTENGLSCHDWVSLDGKVHDPNRIDVLSRNLAFVGRACDEGIPVEGYFQWSIMDNFEWAKGYKERFGLIYVDYATGRSSGPAFHFRDRLRVPKHVDLNPR